MSELNLIIVGLVAVAGGVVNALVGGGTPLITFPMLTDRNGNEFHRHFGFYEYEEILSVLNKAGI